MKFKKKMIEQGKSFAKNNIDTPPSEVYVRGAEDAAWEILTLAEKFVGNAKKEYTGAPNDFRDGFVTGVKELMNYLQIKLEMIK